MVTFFRRLFGADEGQDRPPQDMLIVRPEAQRTVGTWKSVPRAYVELLGQAPITNTFRVTIEVVHIDIRRSGVVGDATNVRAIFAATEIPPQATVDLVFNICASPVFSSVGPWLLADLILWDTDGRRHKLTEVRFRDADAGDAAGG